MATVGMLSVVIVGNSATVVLDGRMVTPRGCMPAARAADAEARERRTTTYACRLESPSRWIAERPHTH